MRRRTFLSTLGVASCLAGSTAPAFPASRLKADDRLGAALVLSGGGARGAYQAGVITAQVEARGIKDGEPFPGIDVVCGASIGALNGWMVATAQYTRLTHLWKTIASVQIFKPKPEYAKIRDVNSGVLTRLGQAMDLGQGLVTDVRGVLDSAPVKSWIDSEVDPGAQLVIPLAFMVTNLTLSASQIFYRPASVARATAAQRTIIAEKVRGLTAGAVAREATDDLLRDALRASATLPVLFDPVTIDGPNGPEDFVDGGIANNSPVDVARGVAKNVYCVFLDPDEQPPQQDKNAVAVGLSSLGIAQHRSIDLALRSAYVETNLKRELIKSGALIDAGLLNSIFDVNLYVLHPQSELPAKVGDFSNQAALDATFDMGYRAGRSEWSAFRPAYD